MVVGIFKRLFSRQNDWVPEPILGVGGINYEGVLRLNSEDVSFDLNGKVPKLYIKGREVGVVVMTNHYVTKHDSGEGVNLITFVYLTEGYSEEKVLSIDRITGEVFNQ
ncbi:hypothetical protein IGI69_002695 [Enterococcus sp. DIV1083b]|uniref:hypothetical protein n=1 Tax=Enterococcus sp. DIV1083b TaxID=2774661 RepID=UPI003F22A16D